MWKGSRVYLCPGGHLSPNAGVAQSVEHRFCKPRVGGSNPFASSSIRNSESNFRQAAELLGDATGFSNALHSELYSELYSERFRRAVIFAR